MARSDDRGVVVKQLEHQGVKFRVEVHGKERPRILVFTEYSRILYTSFDSPLDYMRKPDWSQINFEIKCRWDQPARGIKWRNEWYGKDGKYAEEFPPK